MSGYLNEQVNNLVYSVGSFDSLHFGLSVAADSEPSASPAPFAESFGLLPIPSLLRKFMVKAY
jgi:hypothetical protein